MAKAQAPAGYKYAKDTTRPGKYKLVKINDKALGDTPKRPVPAKKKAVAPPGFTYAKDPARPGKYKLVKKGAGASTAKPVTAEPMGFVESEIARQVGQDQQLTTFVDQQTASIADTMLKQSNEAAAIAGQYAPVTQYQNGTLDANAQARIAEDAGLTNQVNQDQQGALAELIAKSGAAGSDLLGVMRASGQLQHRDYARRIEGLRPELERQYKLEQLAIAQQKAEEKRALEQHALAMKTGALQNQLAVDQFGLAAQNQQFGQSMASQEAAAGAAGNGKPAEKGIYGFGKERDESIQQVIQAWNNGQSTVNDKGETVDPAVKNPWRDLHQGLIHNAALTPDQAALLATRMSPASIKNAKSGAKGVVTMLKNRGVSTKVQGYIIKKYFGAETWASISSNGAQRPAGASSGTYQPTGVSDKPPYPTKSAGAGKTWNWNGRHWVRVPKPVVNWRPLG